MVRFYLESSIGVAVRGHAWRLDSAGRLGCSPLADATRCLAALRFPAYDGSRVGWPSLVRQRPQSCRYGRCSPVSL
jgi:hypothetical protein